MSTETSSDQSSDLGTGGTVNGRAARTVAYLCCWVLVLAVLLGTRAYNYLLFHSVAEVFSMVIAVSIFVLAWNSRQYADNQYLIFLGLGFLFVGILDGVHTLAYKGMGVFPGYGPNLPTQLWIASRVLQNVSLVLAPLFIKRRVPVVPVFLGYTLATVLLLSAIFLWRIFPDCFLEPGGLTRFKIAGEYFIVAILIVALYFLCRQRRAFEPDIFRLLIWSIVLMVASELCFTLYRDVYDIFNMVGHLLKIMAFYLIYRGLMVTGITRPQSLLFRNLQKSEERYRTILETAMDGFWRVDPEGRLLEVNEAYCRMSGYSKPELLARRIADLEGVETPGDTAAHIQSVMLLGEDRFEGQLRRKDGSRLDLDISLQYQPRAGKTIVAFLRDITRRKQAEDLLLKSERKFRAIMDQAADSILVHDLVGRLLEANQQACRILGYTKAELLNLNIGDIDPEAIASGKGQFWAEIAGGKRFTFESRNRRQDGSMFPVEVTIGPIEVGQETLILGIVRDITQRQQAEEALTKSLAEKTALLQEVHHRVKNNLQIVVSLLGLQASRLENREAGEVLEDTRNRVQSMALLHEVLYRSSNLARINFATYVAELCQSLWRSFGGAAGRVTLENRVAPLGLPMDLSLPCGLIINELVSNALKHAFPGERRGHIAVELAPGPPGHLTLTVQDDGVGLPTGVDVASSPTLGLRLVCRLAAQMGGQITMSRPEGGGTAITLSFPVPVEIFPEV